MYNEDFDQDLPYEEREEVEATCPECGSERIVKYTRADGQDDFIWVYECLECGGTWEG